MLAIDQWSIADLKVYNVHQSYTPNINGSRLSPGPTLITFYAPVLSESMRTALLTACDQTQQLWIDSRYLAHEDFMGLLSPIALVNDAVDLVLTIMLTPYSDVSHYSVGVTQEFLKTIVSHIGTSRRYQRLHHEDLQLNIFREFF